MKSAASLSKCRSSNLRRGVLAEERKCVAGRFLLRGKVRATSSEDDDVLGSEDTPLLNRDRGERVSDYIGGEAWEKYRETFPRVFPTSDEDGGESPLKEAVFPESFYGTKLQRSLFPEDLGERAYVEYDTLPPYEGDVLHRVEEAEQLLNSGKMDQKEIDFWFRNPDMPDTGFPLKIECDKLKDYKPEEYDLRMSDNDVFTPLCPTLQSLPRAEDTLAMGQEVRGKVMGAHTQFGLLVDLGCNIAGLVPMYHHEDKRGLSSHCFETLGVEKFDELFGQDKEVRVRVHALRLQQYTAEAARGTYIYRFPVELELLEPGLDSGVLAPPLDAESGAAKAPVVVRDARDGALWEEMARATGRDVSAAFLGDLEAMAEEYDMAQKEQFDNIKDMEIFDPNHDDYEKRRGAADPDWGIRNL